ncbi:peptidoglycan DD-metalloendopeptidase family protein [Paraliomyxa miuraensis]|uniref:peptidoglycan DD-metalloendopeptidase family protein n=1 Tax=Paraliomyxa miuraensis TaxID=376150 RepID=UPI00225489DF|nr:peptidoglycan DD-metalloendopeptidase family protein [Paraliomyxa miuraensis]MCX4239539.1 peptidoglycan DD-metalloendopeptidase family protein [Paraliomyxa miuraensis]
MRRGLGIALVIGGVAAAAVSGAHALTPPIAGAVASPVPVPAPFPAGSRVRVLAGYSPSGGSGLHADTDACCKANDHYALDLVYDDQPNAGLGLPIVAPFAGEVVRAGWATSGWANYGLRVILRHDLGDGHLYHTLHAHLNAIDPAVVEGGNVAAGQVLGELGQSCQGALSCGSFSTPHLHWAMHRDSTVGGSGTGGSFGGNAVVPEPMSGYEDLVQGLIMEIGEAMCGDGVCSGGEDSGSCPQDCPSCGTIPPEGRTIEETDLCFAQSGSPQYWYDANVGSAGACLWTHAVDAAQADDSGRWDFVFEQAGSALVEAYIEPGFAGSMQAKYVVTHAAGVSDVVIDQASASGWTELGTFDFDQGGGQSVRLDDNTGEPFSDMRVLAFDAIRVSPLGGGPGTTSGDDATSGGGLDESGGDPSAADGTLGDGTVGDGIGSDDGITSDGGLSGIFPGAGGSDSEGCACRSAPAGSTGRWWWLLSVAFLRRRRRR